MTKVLYCSIPGITDPINVTVSESHDSSTATANIQCISTTKGIGDYITVSMGTTDSYGVVFTGYIKSIEKSVPSNTYQIMAYDEMIRGVDYFIASSSPDNPFRRRNITAEALVGDILSLAGLTNYTYQATSFTFGINSDVEVNLTSVYDYCTMICRLLTWHIYSDRDGQIHFVNRKPYVMTGNTGQPGDIVDERVKSPDYTINSFISIQRNQDERNLRNKVVVYGAAGIYASASASSPYLPNGFYKTAVVGTSIIDTQSMAQISAEYNLNFFNRLGTTLDITVVGDHAISARQIVRVVDPNYLGIDSNWYVFSCEHTFSSSGYLVTLHLRQ